MSYDGPVMAVTIPAKLTKDEERALRKALKRLGKMAWPHPLAGSHQATEWHTDLLEGIVKGKP